MEAIHFLLGQILFFAVTTSASTDGLDHILPTGLREEKFLRDKLYENQYVRDDLAVCGTCLKGRRDPCSWIVPRMEWHARETKHADYMINPVSIVFIHHTVMERCYNEDQCIQAMQKVQEFHVLNRRWDDIGYSFVVGEDGRAYEGRGYRRVGAHTLGWNNVSIAIGVMGNFSDDLPNGPALEAIRNVIECGIQLGQIMPDYKLYGHCDARPMFESPGRKLYRHIKTWPHYEYRIPIEKLRLQLLNS